MRRVRRSENTKTSKILHKHTTHKKLSWICIAALTTFWNIEEKFDPDLEEKDEQLSTLDGLKIVFQNKVREKHSPPPPLTAR